MIELQTYEYFTDKLGYTFLNPHLDNWKKNTTVTWCLAIETPLNRTKTVYTLYLE